MKFGLRFEKRLESSKTAAFLVPVISIILALIFGGLILLFTGHNPVEVYVQMFLDAYGSSYGLSETIVKAIPLILCGLGVAIAFRMLLWNIGAEGQLYMGAFAASWVALWYPDLPVYIMLPAMFLVGFIAGGLWALLPAIPRAYLGVNEIITSLMLNYVAILWVDYLVYGPWKDPKGFNFPLTAPFSDAARLPMIPGTRIHMGLVFGIAAALALSLLLWRTRWGYEIRVIGENPVSARYAGMNISRNIIFVMFLSGGLAGLAGMAEVSGITHRLTHGLSPGYGYTAIIIAWLAKLNPWSVILVSFLFGGLLVGGYSIQIIGVPAAIATMLQGAILFFVLGGEVFVKYRVRIILPWTQAGTARVSSEESA